jgi:glycosyltransferase involved in cell wall biosynthesis
MKILIVHNAYQQRGGEDSVMEAEKKLLLSAGHEIIEHFRHNDEIRDYSFTQKIRLAASTVWASDTYHFFRRFLRAERPDIAHFYNTLPLISPSAYHACREEGVPVVQAIQNYRLFCPGGNFFREERACEDCVEHSLLRGVLHGCYRNSRPQTAVVASMLAIHRGINTWVECVDAFVVCTQFAREKFISQGLPANKVFLKPNFVFADPGSRSVPGAIPLVVGRLSPEKGMRLLPAAWARLGRGMPLRIVGDGPLREEIRSAFARSNGSGVVFTGWLPREKTIEALRNARFLIFPSQCYEAFPVAIAEAYSCGVPVIACRLGAMAEIVRDQVTGLHFNPGSAEHLADRIEWAMNHPAAIEEMGRAARAEYESKYTFEENCRQIMQIYAATISRVNSRSDHAHLDCLAGQGIH